MPDYSNEEMADIHFMYGRGNGNAYEVQRLYRAQFPNRRLPDPRTFTSVHRRLREHGTTHPPNNEGGRPRTVRTPEVEEEILAMVDQTPSTSTRRIAADVGVSHATVWRTLHEQLLYPYHIQRVQALIDRDHAPRVEFCRWLLEECARNPLFMRMILFTDEVQFTRDAIMNFHNNHIWADENPHAIVQSRHQQTFSVNVWGGIVGDHLLGPFFLPRILNGENYLHFLQHDLPGLLEEVPLHVRHNGYFMHDGAPAHFRIIVREFLGNIYPNRWIGREGPIAWPARSPDCNPLDFFLWGHLKTLVYRQPVPNVEELRERIVAGFQTVRDTPGILERVRQSMRRRMEACIEVGGGTF